jgi:hypothetical protein
MENHIDILDAALDRKQWKKITKDAFMTITRSMFEQILTARARVMYVDVRMVMRKIERRAEARLERNEL